MTYRTCRCKERGCQCVTPSDTDICHGCQLGLHVAMRPVYAAIGDEMPTRWSLLRVRLEDGRFLSKP